MTQREFLDLCPRSGWFYVTEVQGRQRTDNNNKLTVARALARKGLLEHRREEYPNGTAGDLWRFVAEPEGALVERVTELERVVARLERYIKLLLETRK
jgi:hypothetical protein